MPGFLKSDKNFYNARLAYIVFVLLYSIARQYIVAFQPVLMNDIFNFVVVFFAGIVFLWDFIFHKNVIKTKNTVILSVIFLLTLLISIIKFKYGFIDNIKAAANMFIQFFVLYSTGKKMTKDRIKFEIKVIGLALSVFWMIAALISNIMYFLDITYTQTNYIWGDAKPIQQGFVHEDDGAVIMRLWGVFVDPNFAASISIIVVCLCVFLIIAFRSKIAKILSVLNIATQVVYIILSGSRMAMLTCLLLAAVAGWYFGWGICEKIKQKLFDKKVIKEVFSIVLAGVCAASFFVGYTVIKAALPYARQGVVLIESATQKSEPKVGKIGTLNAKINIIEASSEVVTNGVQSLDRGDVAVKSDISNGRFDMWLEGIEVFKTSPLLGVGPRTYSAIAKEINPKMSITHRSIHNSYLELLMGNGIVGFGLMLAFFVLFAIEMLKFRRKKSEENLEMGVLTLIVLSAMAGGMFISSLFYYLSGISIIVFTMMGYGMALAFNQTRADRRNKIIERRNIIQNKIKLNEASAGSGKMDIEALMKDYEVYVPSIKKEPKVSITSNAEKIKSVETPVAKEQETVAAPVVEKPEIVETPVIDKSETAATPIVNEPEATTGSDIFEYFEDT